MRFVLYKNLFILGIILYVKLGIRVKKDARFKKKVELIGQ